MYWNPRVTELAYCLSRTGAIKKPLGDADLVGAEPEGAAIEEMGLGWISSHGSGKGSDTITSGIEGAWTADPTKWDNGYFDLLLGYEWELTKSPAGAHIWHAVDPKDSDLAPDAEDASIRVPTMMTTADMASPST